MDANRRARSYLERHGVEKWFRAAAERLIVTQPENPMHALYEALGKEMETREKLTGTAGGWEEGSASLVARIVVRGRGGVRKEINLDKIANPDMLRGARGASMVREWGSLLGSRVSEALVGSGQGGDALDGEVKAAAASMEGVDDGGGARSSEGEPDGKDGGGGGGGGAFKPRFSQKTAWNMGM